jgi:serine/threonine-protein kinase
VTDEAERDVTNPQLGVPESGEPAELGEPAEVDKAGAGQAEAAAPVADEVTADLTEVDQAEAAAPEADQAEAELDELALEPGEAEAAAVRTDELPVVAEGEPGQAAGAAAALADAEPAKGDPAVVAGGTQELPAVTEADVALLPANGAEPAKVEAEPAGAGPESPATSFEGHFLTGRVLGNRYRLADRIAVGGMGQVWRGTDELLGRTVAIKLLSSKYAADDQFRTRFRAEARYAASLSHPGIAQVYDYGESDQGTTDPLSADFTLPYLVMELVEGEPLSAAISRDGGMPVAATLDLVAQAARALAVAHAAGIVHRDIKPGNLLIKPDGQVKITDFGIARAALAAHLTQTGMVMGTAQYVSPEQASARPVTAASDLYSLGVVAYECLAGVPPFTAEAPIALALAHVRQRPPRLPDTVPAPVAALIGQLLAKEPADRPASAQAVAARASALKSAPDEGGDPWIIGSDELAGPAAWFSDPTPTSPVSGRITTAPITAASVAGRAPGNGGARLSGIPRRPLSRRPVVRVLAAAAVIVAATAGTLVAMAASKHPSAPASTSSSPPTQRPAPARSTSQTPGLVNGGSFFSHPTKPTSTVHSPSPSPTTGSPSSSPTTSISPSPSTSPTGSGSPSPTTSPTGSPSPSSSQSPAVQLPLADPQTPSTQTQDG